MPNVLCLVANYLPGYRAGGALRSVSNLAARIADRCEFRVLTSDRDLGDTHPYPDLPTRAWSKIGGTDVYYAAKPLLEVPRIVARTRADVLYLNSFFDPRFGILPVLVWNFARLRRTRLIIAPRGEFSPGALQLKSLKKRLFLAFAKISGLYRKVAWHASTELEAADIRRTLGRQAQDVCVVPDLATPVARGMNRSAHALADRRQRLHLCFVSRISQKKNLDYALLVLRRVEIPIEFNVYGPAEDEAYLASCRSIAATLPENVVVRFRGPLDHSRVTDVFGKHHLFFFPTRGENFGHVISESLAAGTPVLISDQTPWLRLQAAGIGWDLPLAEPAAFAAAIRTLAEMSSDAYERMRALAATYSLGSSSDEIVEHMLSLFGSTPKNAG